MKSGYLLMLIALSLFAANPAAADDVRTMCEEQYPADIYQDADRSTYIDECVAMNADFTDSDDSEVVDDTIYGDENYNDAEDSESESEE